MTNIEAEVEGFRRVLESLDDLEERFDSDRRFLVGTAVNYAIFLEFGTSDMDPKPFFRPALAELRQKGIERFVEDNSNLETEAIRDLDNLLGAVALSLERRIKEIITQKGLIDTGTLRASVLAVPGGDASVLPDEGEFSGFGGDSPAPQSAGRALASADININIQ